MSTCQQSTGACICGAPPCRTGWRGGGRSSAKGAAAVGEARAAAAGAEPTVAMPRSIVSTATAVAGDVMLCIPGTVVCNLLGRVGLSAAGVVCSGRRTAPPHYYALARQTSKCFMEHHTNPVTSRHAI